MSVYSYEWTFLPPDVLASRPDADATRGWFLATDVDGGTLYKSDGASWVQVASGVNASPTIASVTIPFTDGDTMRRVTIADAAVTATSSIVCTIVRPDVLAADDPGYVYTTNVVLRDTGTFDVIVAALGWGFDDPTKKPPDETVTLNYIIS